MKLKQFLLFVVLGLMFVSFAVSQNTAVNSDNLWYQITDFSQLDGTWEGIISHSESQSGVTYNVQGNVILTFDSSANTFSQDMVVNTSFSGVMARLFWGRIKSSFEDNDEVNAIINDSTRTITIIENTGPRVMDDEERENLLNSSMINQNGTQIKWNDNQFEIILTRR